MPGKLQWEGRVRTRPRNLVCDIREDGPGLVTVRERLDGREPKRVLVLRKCAHARCRGLAVGKRRETRRAAVAVGGRRRGPGDHAEQGQDETGVSSDASHLGLSQERSGEC